MANSYFQFKEFIIHQADSAMKVTTDACLFGAWMTKNVPMLPENFVALDIGTGTGLLSLMFIQNNCARKIDAVEIDAAAAVESKKNIALSKWENQITVFNEPIQDFVYKRKERYHFVFSNPPYYENDLKSVESQKNTAFHSTHLDIETLVTCIQQSLLPNGFFAIILPYKREKEFEKLCTHKNLFFYRKMYVQQTEKHPFFRTMFLGSNFKLSNEINSSMSIKINQEYSNEFVELLKPYYLHL
ncbi:MAG: tRNA1(Val) (adenine(37)-N6)-methyltransferase [Chitinophagaceae bacterium]